MKRIIIPIILVALGLAGCGSSKANNNSTNGSDPNARGLPPVTRLVLGTFKLEGTAQAVTAEQASELLPMWQVYESMYQSDTAAQEEVDALVEQIQGSMSGEQVQAIQDMNLTQQDYFTLMQEQGIQMAGPGEQNMSAEQIATVQALRSSGAGGPGEQGGMPGGGMPGGAPGGMPMDGGRMPGGTGGVQANGTQTAGGQPRDGGMERVPPALLDALIELLKTRAAS